MTIVWKFVYIVNTNGTVVSADLGNSSNYSNEIHNTVKGQYYTDTVFVKL